MTPPLSARPRTVEGLGGACTLVFTKSVREVDGAIGLCQPQSRKIIIQTELPPATEVATFYHELFHLAIEDSGLSHDLDDVMTEKLCDLVGSMMARLKVRL